MRYAQMFPELPNICGQGLSGAGEGCWFYASRPNTQEPIQKTQQYTTAKQRFVKKGVQGLFPLCTGTPGHN